MHQLVLKIFGGLRFDSEYFERFDTTGQPRGVLVLGDVLFRELNKRGETLQEILHDACLQGRRWPTVRSECELQVVDLAEPEVIIGAFEIAQSRNGHRNLARFHPPVFTHPGNDIVSYLGDHRERDQDEDRTNEQPVQALSVDFRLTSGGPLRFCLVGVGHLVAWPVLQAMTHFLAAFHFDKVDRLCDREKCRTPLFAI